MTERWWALLDKNGAVIGQLCQTDPPLPRHAAGLRFDRAVQTDRPGDIRLERLDEVAGTWLPDDVAIETMKIAAIKAQAERDCLAVAPLWQQLNDVRKPTPEGAARFAAIDAIRAASNKAEADIKKVKNNG